MRLKKEIMMVRGNIIVLLLVMFYLFCTTLGLAEEVKEYWPNGKVKWERNYKDGKLEGISKNYDENGTLRSEENYAGDKKEGMSKYFSDKGKLIKEVNFKANVKDGVETTYHRWDNKKTVTTYKHGKTINEKYYDKQGRLRDEFSFEYSDKGGWTIHQKMYDEKGNVILDQDVR